MTTTFLAHFDGNRSLVLDEPVDLPVGTPLRVQVEAVPEEVAPSPQATVNKVTHFPRSWMPLDIQIDPELSNAIALDPEFGIEES
jgi:hypothetical protein